MEAAARPRRRWPSAAASNPSKPHLRLQELHRVVVLQGNSATAAVVEVAAGLITSTIQERSPLISGDVPIPWPIVWRIPMLLIIWPLPSTRTAWVLPQPRPPADPSPSNRELRAAR